MNEPDRVLVEIVVAAPVERVWRALRDPAELRRWFGWEHAGIAEEIDLIFINGTEASEADRVLRFIGMSDRFTLEACGEHTIVRIIRSAPLTDPGWTGVYDDVVEGWLTFVQQLRFTVERHDGVDRRTLYLNGRAPSSATPLPSEALGLSALARVQVGQRYAVASPTGETLSGLIWFRAPYQLGVTVDAFGDGLVIANARPTTDKSPHGGGNVVLTTYGFDDDGFSSLRERWEAWFRATYEVIEIQPA